MFLKIFCSIKNQFFQWSEIPKLAKIKIIKIKFLILLAAGIATIKYAANSEPKIVTLLPKLKQIWGYLPVIAYKKKEKSAIAVRLIMSLKS